MAINSTTYYFDFSKKSTDLLGTKDFTLITNEQAIKESVINILSTEKGTRPMYPEYGISLSKFLFEPIDEVTSSLMTFEITRALEGFEPRINNIEVNVYPNEEELTFIIEVSFQVVYNNKQEAVQINFSKIR